MIHMIQNAKDQVLALTNTAYQTAAAQGKLPGDVQVRANVEIPKDPANGDYTTTFALAAAKAMKRSPREIAAVLAESMDLAGSYFDSVEIAGAGFLNFRLGRKWYADTLSAVESEGGADGPSGPPPGRQRMVGVGCAPPPRLTMLKARHRGGYIRPRRAPAYPPPFGHRLSGREWSHGTSVPRLRRSRRLDFRRGGLQRQPAIKKRKKSLLFPARYAIILELKETAPRSGCGEVWYRA